MADTATAATTFAASAHALQNYGRRITNPPPTLTSALQDLLTTEKNLKQLQTYATNPRSASQVGQLAQLQASLAGGRRTCDDFLAMLQESVSAGRNGALSWNGPKWGKTGAGEQERRIEKYRRDLQTWRSGITLSLNVLVIYSTDHNDEGLRQVLLESKERERTLLKQLEGIRVAQETLEETGQGLAASQRRKFDEQRAMLDQVIRLTRECAAAVVKGLKHVQKFGNVRMGNKNYHYAGLFGVDEMITAVDQTYGETEMDDANWVSQGAFSAEVWKSLEKMMAARKT